MCEPGRSLNHLSKHVVDAAQNVLCPLLTLCGQKRYYTGSYEDNASVVAKIVQHRLFKKIQK